MIFGSASDPNQCWCGEWHGGPHPKRKRPVQTFLRGRLAALPDGEWYFPRSPSERTALSFMFKRGEVERMRGSRGALEYRLARPTDGQLEIDGQYGAKVVRLGA